MPSLSSQPSSAPTISAMPSVSSQPSSAPTISAMPSVSAQPSWGESRICGSFDEDGDAQCNRLPSFGDAGFFFVRYKPESSGISDPPFIQNTGISGLCVPETPACGGDCEAMCLDLCVNCKLKQKLTGAIDCKNNWCSAGGGGCQNANCFDAYGTGAKCGSCNCNEACDFVPPPLTPPPGSVSASPSVVPSGVPSVVPSDSPSDVPSSDPSISPVASTPQCGMGVYGPGSGNSCGNGSYCCGEYGVGEQGCQSNDKMCTQGMGCTSTCSGNTGYCCPTGTNVDTCQTGLAACL